MTDVDKKLDKIINYLKILTEDKIELKKIVNTVQRRKMYRLMTGENSFQDIATIVGLSDQAVRDFVKQVNKAGFVVIKQSGKSSYPIKLI